jgi:hypothetical protein
MSWLTTRTLASWVVMLGFLAFGLLYLNGAIFSAWVSGGPPNPYPVGWSRRALGQLSFSVASFLLAVGAFRLVRALPVWRRSAVVLVAVGLALLVAPYIGRFVLQDQCLDSGGSWSNLTLECTRRANVRLTLRCTRSATAGFARFRTRVNSNVRPNGPSTHHHRARPGLSRRTRAPSSAASARIFIGLGHFEH